jgi:hypothetical protein
MLFMFPGRGPRDGGVVSCTVTVNEADAEFECASVTLQVTGVVPILKALPDAGVQVGVIDPSTRSVAEAANVTLAPEAPVASAVRLPGDETLGAVVSTTVTVNDVCPCVLSVMSVAVHVTSVEPS